MEGAGIKIIKRFFPLRLALGFFFFMFNSLTCMKPMPHFMEKHIYDMLHVYVFQAYFSQNLFIRFRSFRCFIHLSLNHPIPRKVSPFFLIPPKDWLPFQVIQEVTKHHLHPQTLGWSRFHQRFQPLSSGQLTIPKKLQRIARLKKVTKNCQVKKSYKELPGSNIFNTPVRR